MIKYEFRGSLCFLNTLLGDISNAGVISWDKLRISLIIIWGD